MVISPGSGCWPCGGTSAWLNCGMGIWAFGMNFSFNDASSPFPDDLLSVDDALELFPELLFLWGTVSVEDAAAPFNGGKLASFSDVSIFLVSFLVVPVWLSDVEG